MAKPLADVQPGAYHDLPWADVPQHMRAHYLDEWDIDSADWDKLSNKLYKNKYWVELLGIHKTLAKSMGYTPETWNDVLTVNCDFSVIRIDVNTDNSPKETSWTLKNECDYSDYYGYEFPVFEVEKGDLSESLTKHVWEYCVMKQAEWKFKIKDRAGDGICCDDGTGWYELYLDRDSQGGGFAARANWTNTDTVSFGPTDACLSEDDDDGYFRE